MFSRARGREDLDGPRRRCQCKVLTITPSGYFVRLHMSKTARPNFTKFFVHVTCSRSSIVLRRQHNVLCISSFVVDVVLAHMSILARYRRGKYQNQNRLYKFGMAAIHARFTQLQ